MLKTLKTKDRVFLLVVSSSALLFIRPRFAFTTLGTHDGPCYMNWLYRFLWVPEKTCFFDSYLPGVAATWIPAGLVGRMLSTFFGGDLYQWIPAIVGAYTFVLWAICLFLLDRFLDSLKPNKPFLTLILFFNFPLIYYATYRTAFTHVVEIFLTLLCMVTYQSGKKLTSFWVLVLLSLTRVNAIAILFPLGFDFFSKIKRERMTRWIEAKNQHALVVGITVIVFSFTKILFDGYNDTSLVWVLRQVSLDDLNRVLFGKDWGLFWSSPIWLFALVMGGLNWKSLSAMGKGNIVWMLSAFLFAVGWRGNGSDFGYRYLMGSYLAAAAIVVETIPSWKSLRGRAFYLLAALNAFWMSYLAWIWKMFPETVPKRHFLDWGLTVPNLQVVALSGFLIRKSWTVPLRESLTFFVKRTSFENLDPIAFTSLTIFSAAVILGFYALFPRKIMKRYLPKGKISWISFRSHETHYSNSES